MIHTFDDLELDTRAFELRRSATGEVVAMEPQVFDVLRFLVEHADRVVGKEELLDSVWGTRFVTESALTSRIKDARKAVGDDGRAQRVIRTVHGRGYRFVAALAGRADTGAPAPGRTGPPPAPAGPGLLERDHELATLAAAVEDARCRASGTVVLISGEAGLGKTTLVRAVSAMAADQGVRVLSGGCDDLTTPRTLGPLRDLAHEVGGRLAEAFAGGADLEEVFAALPEVLAETPTVVVIEDLHWADDATLDVVRFLTRRIPALPAVFITTYREEEVGAGHRLRRVLGGLAGTSVRRMALAPLSLDAVTTLAGGLGVSAAELHAVTRGNPFFVSEVLAARELRVPPTVRDAVLARVDSLGPAARRLLQDAAVLPSRAERWLLAELVPDAHLASAEAEQAGVLSGDQGHVWFRHELARQAVEESLTAATRVRANQRVLDVLAKHRDIEPARLVHHAERAGDGAAVIDHAPGAAAEAIRLGSYSQAIHHLELLLAHAGELPDRTVAIATSQLSYALYMVNRFADSARHGWRGVAAAEAAGDPEVLADALRWLSRTLYWSDGPRAAAATVERALPLVEQVGDPARLATAHAELARAHSDLVTVGPVAEPDPRVVEHAERSLELAEGLGHAHLRCHALQYRGTGRLALGDARGVADLALAVELAHLDPRDELPTRACVNAAGGSFRAGRLDDAERYVLLGLERSTGGEFTAGAYRLELTLQGVRISRGEWDEAEAGLRTLVDWPGEPGIMRPLAASLLVRLLARRGRQAEADDLLRRTVDGTSGSSEIAVVGPVAIAAVEAAWLAGEGGRMPTLAGPALALATELGHRTTRAELARLLQHASHPVDVPPDPPGPWAPGLAGRWRAAADAWGALGHRYERAVELAVAPDAGARSEGRGDLAALGAYGTLGVLG
ncbi:MAG TPA: AAA family ATPase [Acidimicrobiales bacterium]|nr:AAA family ATPase [Acidimicrobiales bacterium]